MSAAGREPGGGAGPRGRRRQKGSAGAVFNCVHARGAQLHDEAVLRALSGGLHLQAQLLRLYPSPTPIPTPIPTLHPQPSPQP